MEFNLKGKTAIITGGSKGIGKAVAEAFVKEGINLTIVARNLKTLSETKSLLCKKGGSVIAVSGDVKNVHTARITIKKTINEYRGIDFLINCAGGAVTFGNFVELTNEDWIETYALNVLSIVNFTRTTIQYLKKSSSGRIINITSLTGLQPGLFNPHYAAAKAAAINLNKYLANYYAKDRILVNTVCAGPIHTSAWNDIIGHVSKKRFISFQETSDQMEEEEKKKIPLGRLGEPEDIANLVTFLVSSQASWITGSCILIDGGKLKTI